MMMIAIRKIASAMAAGGLLAASLLAACSNNSGSATPSTSTSVPGTIPAPTTTGTPPAPGATHSLAAVHGVGVNLAPTDLLDSTTNQPSGTALATMMANDGVQLVRLDYGNQSPTELANGGWRQIFDRLQASHINVLLVLHQQYPQQSEGPGVTGGRITDLNALITTEDSVLTSIKSQFAGTYPQNLVALDVFNEPVLDASTAPTLQQLAAAIKAFSGGLPTTIGGWRNSVANTAQGYNDPSLTGLAASIGDFVSVHLYPANMPGGSETATDVASILPFAQSFLTIAIGAIASSGHAGTPVLITETGGANGQAPTGGFQRGGSPAHQQATIQAVLQAATADAGQGVRGALIWWMAPPPSESCNGMALVCFNGAYTSPAIPLIAANQFH